MDLKAIAFDLDGTIYFGDQVADGALETVKYFENRGIQTFFFTNNSSNSRKEVLVKLQKMGFNPDISHIYTSGFASARYLKSLGLERVFCLGSDGLIDELVSLGINVTHETGEAQALLIGLDRKVTYEKMAVALNVLKNGVRTVACNRDRSFPVENGRLMPGCGAIVAAIEFSAGEQIGDIVGKPNIYMIDMLSKDFGLDPKSILVVGDSIDSDIEMARNYGCPAVLVSEKYSDNAPWIPTISKLIEVIERFNRELPEG